MADTNEWTNQLESARQSLARGDSVTAFLRAFGALESCYSHEADLPINSDDSFKAALKTLRDKKRLSRDHYDLADHLRAARNCVAHASGFEPSGEEAERAINHVHKLCHRFATRVHDIMIKPVTTARASDPVGPLVDLMRDHGISQFPVVDSDGRLEGTLFEKAVLESLVAAEGIFDLNQPVSTLMSTTLLPDIPALETVVEARRRLCSPGVSALLVLADRRPTGIVTRFDVIG